METKLIEIRDSMTCIAAMATKMEWSNEPELAFLRREGFDGSQVILMRLGNQEATSDPYGWKGGTRTMPQAHKFIIENWDTIDDGYVVDVEFILGETPSRKSPEIYRG